MTNNARTAQELADELERKIGEYEVTCCIAGMNERAPMTLEMERNAIKAIVRRLAALASQAEPAPSVKARLTDEQIVAIGRRAVDKCCGAEAQHIYIAREIERILCGVNS